MFYLKIMNFQYFSQNLWIFSIIKHIFNNFPYFFQFWLGFAGFPQDYLFVVAPNGLSAKWVFKSSHNLLKGGFRPADHDGNVRIGPNRPVRPQWAFMYPKIPMLPNRTKIGLWVPRVMQKPIAPTFGRIDAFLGSSVEICADSGNARFNQTLWESARRGFSTCWSRW